MISCFSLDAVKTLYLWVSVVWLWCSLWTYLVLEFIRLLKSVRLCLLPHLGDFQPLFCQIFFSSILSILFFIFHFIFIFHFFIFPYVRAFEIIPQVPEAHFFPVFSLFFRWFLLMYLQVSPLLPLSSTFYYWAIFKFQPFFFSFNFFSFSLEIAYLSFIMSILYLTGNGYDSCFKVLVC